MSTRFDTNYLTLTRDGAVRFESADEAESFLAIAQNKMRNGAVAIDYDLSTSAPGAVVYLP